MKFKRNLILSLLLAAMTTNAVRAGNTPLDGEITSADIMQNIAQLIGMNEESCLEFKVEGICIWITYYFFGVIVEESIKVRHYIPEVVVSAYDEMGQSPWKEMKSVNEKVMEIGGTKIGGSHAGNHEVNRGIKSVMKRKNADAIGSPNLIVFSQLHRSEPAYFCEPQTTPYQPYYLSGVDFISWGALSLVSNIPELAAGIADPEILKGLMPTQRELGNTENPHVDQWGNIYPRTGVTTQVHDYKASALIAQRVADFLTREWSFHILPFGSLTKKDKAGVWYPKKIIENKKGNHKWRMLYPKLETQCHLFGNRSTTDTYGEKTSPQNNYSWELWRPYSCCERKGAILLSVIDF